MAAAGDAIRERLPPDEAHRDHQLLERAPVFVVDLRHRIDVEADPHTLPDALRLDADELELRHLEIPRDRDVVLYCT